MTVVYDYSFARPDPASLGGNVMRYLCSGHQGGKRLEADELATLHAAGLRVGLVWENDTADPDGGYQAGTVNGVDARAQARALGFPDTVPIYWAVDKRLTTATRARAVEYGKGFTDAAGLARPYGEAALIDAAVDANLCDGGWCPETWGSTDHAVLVQLVNPRDGVTSVTGTDANVATTDAWGGWHPNDPTTGDEMDAQQLHDAIVNNEKGVRDAVAGVMREVVEDFTYKAIIPAVAASHAAAAGSNVTAAQIAGELLKQMKD